MCKIPHLIKRNANNQRVAKEVNGTIVEKYLWLNQTTLLAVYDGNDNLKYRFEYAGERTPIAYTNADNQIFYLSYNHLGSLKAVRNQSSRIIKTIDYDSFGNVLSETNPSDSSGSNPSTASIDIPLGFAGGLYDRDTKLIRFGYRDYDPYIGRWTAKDPIDFNGGDSNLYAYVGNDPVNGVDPEGLYTIEKFYSDMEMANFYFAKNYIHMRQANTIGADKYFHCKANCEAASLGFGGFVQSMALSELRETLDEYLKGDSTEACNEDRKANDYGRIRGFLNPTGASCKQICRQFRPNGLPSEY